MPHKSTTTLEMRVGEKVRLIFNGTSSAGYEWNHDSGDTSNLWGGLDISVLETVNGDAFGAGAVKQFTIAARKLGDYKITFCNKAPWEGEPAEVQTFVVFVRP